MSLISDALTQARQRDQQSRVQANPELSRNMLRDALNVSPKTPPESNVEKKQSKAWPVATVCGVVILALITVAMLTFPQLPQQWLSAFDQPQIVKPLMAPPQELADSQPSSEASPIEPPATSQLTPDSVRANFRLSGILYSGSQSVAVINNNVLTLGQQIENATVSKIETDHVVLSVGTNEFSLYLSTPQSIITSASQPSLQN